MDDFNVDALIDRLLQVGQMAGPSFKQLTSEEEILKLCELAREVFLSQPPMVEVEAPIRVCGDIHGQYADLMRLFAQGGFPPGTNYLFLGDYVDRGKNNLETICLMFAYKVRYPKNFFTLRGNHECDKLNRAYGFYDECERRSTIKVYHAFQEVFTVLPFTALIGGRVLCMHGGLSPQLRGFTQLRTVELPMEPVNPSVYIDLLWADPERNTTGFVANTRGVSYTFGQDVVTDFCRRMELDMIARAHQVVQDGYEFFAGRRMVTIFSAPHYCGEFDNSAAIMSINKDMVCSFEILKPGEKKKLYQ